MGTKADYTEEQWHELLFAVQNTMAFVSFANGAKFWEGMKEASASAKFMREQFKSSESALIRDLASTATTKHEKLNTADPAAMEKQVLDSVAEATKLVADTSPEDLDAYKAFIIGVAESAAEAADGVDEAEQTAIDKVKSALV